MLIGDRWDDTENFSWADLKAAVVFEKMGGSVIPALELTYLGDYYDFNELLLRPEVIVPFNKSASLKLGGILSLSDDGNQGGFAGSLAYGF